MCVWPGGVITRTDVVQVGDMTSSAYHIYLHIYWMNFFFLNNTFKPVTTPCIIFKKNYKLFFTRTFQLDFLVKISLEMCIFTRISTTNLNHGAVFGIYLITKMYIYINFHIYTLILPLLNGFQETCVVLVVRFDHYWETCYCVENINVIIRDESNQTISDEMNFLV